MSIVLIAPGRDMSGLKDAIHQKAPDIDVEVWPRITYKKRVRMAVCWKHPSNILGQFPNLALASSLGAGVNHLLADKDLAENIPISRVITKDLKEQMAEYALLAVLSYRRTLLHYISAKNRTEWKPISPVPMEQCTVGVMGLGEMGHAIAQRLAGNGFTVNGWSRSKKNMEDLKTFAGHSEMKAFLEQSNIVICALPLTDETSGILDLQAFKQMKKPSYLINMGRGQHLVEEDLIYALDTNLIEGAFLDVFEEEPLPDTHTFWNRKNIMLTPHIAAITDLGQAAEVIAENYKRCQSGMPPLYQADRKKEY